MIRVKFWFWFKPFFRFVTINSCFQIILLKGYRIILQQHLDGILVTFCSLGLDRFEVYNKVQFLKSVKSKPSFQPDQWRISDKGGKPTISDSFGLAAGTDQLIHRCALSVWKCSCRLLLFIFQCKDTQKVWLISQLFVGVNVCMSTSAGIGSRPAVTRTRKSVYRWWMIRTESSFDWFDSLQPWF